MRKMLCNKKNYPDRVNSCNMFSKIFFCGCIHIHVINKGKKCRLCSPYIINYDVRAFQAFSSETSILQRQRAYFTVTCNHCTFVFLGLHEFLGTELHILCGMCALYVPLCCECASFFGIEVNPRHNWCCNFFFMLNV